MCATCTSGARRGWKSVPRALELVTDYRELPRGCWESNLGPQEQPVKPLFHPRSLFLEDTDSRTKSRHLLELEGWTASWKYGLMLSSPSQHAFLLSLGAWKKLVLCCPQESNGIWDFAKQHAWEESWGWAFRVEQSGVGLLFEVSPFSQQTFPP